MRKAGQSRGAVAEALGVHPKTITRWSGEHRQRGAAIFAARRRGPKLGEARHLSPAQEKALQRLIIEKTPDQLKLAFALWTRRAACELIEAEFALRMPIRTRGEYLKRWGFAHRGRAAAPRVPSPRAPRRSPRWVLPASGRPGTRGAASLPALSLQTRASSSPSAPCAGSARPHPASRGCETAWGETTLPPPRADAVRHRTPPRRCK